MAENNSIRRTSRWRIAAWGSAAFLLLLPLCAMQVTDEVDWGVADFVVFAAMLIGAGGAYELAARRAGNTAYRAGVGIALAAAFFLVWLNLAVGLVGGEDHPANLMYGGVLAVGIIGAVGARFQPCGLAHTLAATALAQVLVAVIALVSGLGSAEANWSGGVVVLTGLFATLWLISAWLFRKAAQGQMSAGSAP